MNTVQYTEISGYAQEQIDGLMKIVSYIQRDVVKDNDCNYNYHEYFKIDKDILKSIDTLQYLQERVEGVCYIQYKNIDEIINTIETIKDIASDVVSSLADESPVDYDEWDYNTLVDNIELQLNNSQLDITYRELAKVIVNTLDLHSVISNIIEKAEAVEIAKEELNNTIENECNYMLENDFI